MEANKEQKVLHMQDENKSFSESELILKNRQNLSLSGVEKIFEMTEGTISMRVSGSNTVISGENLNVVKLDVETGKIEIDGKVCGITFSNSDLPKKNFFKKIFK